MPAIPAREAGEMPASGAFGRGPTRRCEWCGAELGAGARRLRRRTVCGRCGVATTDPLPSDAELESAYRGWYRPASGRFAGPGDAILRRLRNRLASHLDRAAPPGPVLDVGAGAGHLLDALAARGRSAVGLERAASARPGIRAAELGELDGEWAAIVFWHSLEHLRGAGAALDQAARMLAPNGLLVVAMPNAASLQAAVFGDRWLALDFPRHLVHVPEGALRDRLTGLGLRVERTSPLRGGQAVFGWLHGLVGALPGALDLYAAIRRGGARERPLRAPRRAAALAAGSILLPVAVAAALLEAALGRGGSTYVEARRV
ncbi:MAG TPA: class I SAM-dependent methyltransferase [Solirubrobacterales bacterium]